MNKKLEHYLLKEIAICDEKIKNISNSNDIIINNSILEKKIALLQLRARNINNDFDDK